MKIRIISVSKNKFEYIDAAEADYRKRLAHYADIELLSIKEEPITKGKDVEQVIVKEGERIIDALKEGWYTIILDSHGTELTSESFSSILLEQRDFGNASAQFVIGGPLGLSDAVLKRADLLLSFSRMTFTHQLIRVLLLEQIYRGFEIIKGTGYHK